MLGFGLGLNKWRRVGGGYVGLLDLYPNAAAAYSLRLLRKDYSGGLVRARAWDGLANQGEADIMPYRVSANEYVLDLNSTLENLDATAISRGLTTSDTLADLVSTGVNDYDGLTSAWYDQSLSNNATQSTAANQPKIVSGGSLVTENGKPAVDFDGANDYFTLGGTNDAGMVGNISVFSVNKNLGTSTSVVISTGLTGSSSAFVMQWSLTGNTSNRYTGTTSDGTTRINEDVTAANYGSQVLVSMINNESGNLQLFADGVASTGQTAVAPMNDANYPLQIGRDVFRSSYYFSGSMQELVMYSSLPNRTGIETNINTFYSIYP